MNTNATSSLKPSQRKLDLFIHPTRRSRFPLLLRKNGVFSDTGTGDLVRFVGELPGDEARSMERSFNRSDVQPAYSVTWILRSRSKR